MFVNPAAAPPPRATIQQTISAINAACRSRGGVYAQYSCKTVSWDDSQRFGNPATGTVSCWGRNITDTRLFEKNGTQLYTVRSDNWNEKLGRVSSNDIAVVVSSQGGPLKAITLTEYLTTVGHRASYAGIAEGTSLFDASLDTQVSIRFQTTFLPIDDTSLAAVEFCTEAYNYNTASADNPRNAVLLCTTQGVAFDLDGPGRRKLFHHVVEGNGVVSRHWLEAERTSHQVGGAQNETKLEAMQAAARGKATAGVIGVRAMGARFNALMTIQVPLKQRPVVRTLTAGPTQATGLFSFATPASGLGDLVGDVGSTGFGSALGQGGQYAFLGAGPERRPGRGFVAISTGTSNAARVSIGSKQDNFRAVAVRFPERDSDQHITVTIILYNVVAGGVPSELDVQRAIDDMEQLYASCGWTGHLADPGAGFMVTPTMITTATPLFPMPPQTQPGAVQIAPSDTFPPVVASPINAVRHIGVHCDGCGLVPIAGIRYKCMQCDDFDLCESCERVSEGKGRHTLDHIMLKIRNPLPYINSAFLRNRSGADFGAFCQLCTKPIRGFHFRCDECRVMFCETCDFSGYHAPTHTVTRTASGATVHGWL